MLWVLKSEVACCTGVQLFHVTDPTLEEERGDGSFLQRTVKVVLYLRTDDTLPRLQQGDIVKLSSVKVRTTHRV